MRQPAGDNGRGGRNVGDPETGAAGKSTGCSRTKAACLTLDGVPSPTRIFRASMASHRSELSAVSVMAGRRVVVVDVSRARHLESAGSRLRLARGCEAPW